MENFKKLKEIILDMDKDMDKVFNKKQNTAGIRARRNLQEIRILAKELRQDIQNALKDVIS